jgi:uncharacterized repeat protein (TIGR01451 family)
MKNLRILLSFLLVASAIWLHAQCPTSPQLTMPTGGTITCTNPLFYLEAQSSTPNVSWLWTGPNGFSSQQANINAPGPGTYTVVVTEPINGCTNTGTVVVAADVTPPSVSVANITLSCNNPTGTLTATSPTAGVTYQWSGGGATSNTPSFSVNQPGQYIITVTAPNGCTATASATATNNSTPVNLTINSGGGVLNCTNTSVTLAATSTTPNLTYLWTSPSTTILGTTASITVTTPGVYTCVATAPSGCSVSRNTNVSQNLTIPQISTFNDTIGCNGSQGTIGAFVSNTGNSYLWSNGVTDRWITVTNPGQYTVTVTSWASNCTATATATLVTAPTQVNYTVTAGCSGANSGSISIAQVPNMNVQWANGASGSTLQNLAAGTYCVTVTNTIANCTATDCIVVGTNAPIVITATQGNPSCNQNNGWIILSVSGGTPPYTYQWSTGSTVNAFQNLAAGTYTITVTDANGCTAVKSITLIDQTASLFNATIAVANCLGSIQLDYSGTTPPNYTWSNGGTGAVQTNLSPGVYSVQVPVQGCILNLGPYVIPPDGCTQLLRGILREDENDNCVSEATETGLNGWIIKATETTTLVEYFSQTNAAGAYYMGLPLGNYTVQAQTPSTTWANCNNGSPAAFAGPDTLTVDLSGDNLIDCPILDVQISAGLLRRCFSTNYYYVNYCNLGTVTAEDPYVLVTLDPFLEYIGSSIGGTSLGNQVYRFNVADVLPGQCGQFNIQIKVSCDAVLGQTHCTEAHIYPDSLCLPANPSWSGAFLTTESICGADSLRFIIKNVGTAAMTNALDYIVIEDAIMLRQGQTPALAPGASMIVSVPANGSTWRLEVDQEPLSPLSMSPTLSVEGCTNTPGAFSTGFLNIFPMLDSMPWLDIDCKANTGAYDPNDKRGIPEGYGNLHYIEPGTPLEYTIRFQNTGTDTAFTVVITDTLSDNIDPATFQYLGASHGVRPELYGDGILRFTFNNIMLPDSNVNEPASNGFVKFKIAHRQGIPLETDIFNEASIYFDFNAPVVTNRTQHRVGQNFVIVRLHEPDAVQNAQVQPNPVKDRVLVQWTGNTEYYLEVMDATGRVIHSLNGAGSSIALTTNDWKSGIYMIRLLGSDQIVRLAKVVKL